MKIFSNSPSLSPNPPNTSREISPARRERMSKAKQETSPKSDEKALEIPIVKMREKLQKNDFPYSSKEKEILEKILSKYPEKG